MIAPDMIQPIPIPTLSSITPYDFSKPSSSSTHSKSSPPTAASCEYFNRSELALLCSDFLQTLFGCPTTMPSLPNSRNKSKTLAHYIAFALHRTRLSDHVAFSALLLLWKLKLLYPNAKGSSGHRLIISAMLIASKVICDDTYSNKSWCIVAQHVFSLQELCTMERELFSYLQFEVNIHADELDIFMRDILRVPPKQSSLSAPIHESLYALHTRPSYTQQQGQQQQEAYETSETPIPMSPALTHSSASSDESCASSAPTTPASSSFPNQAFQPMTSVKF